MRPGVLGLVILLAGCVPPPIERASDPPRQTAVQRPPAPPEPAKPPEPILAVDPPAPVWEARPVIADAQEVATAQYIVAPGDTLRAIANQTGAGSEAIARANGLVAPFIIRPGQRLMIPGGRYHLVKVGESGIAIARAYGVPWAQIVTANALAEPYVLRVGQRILIPTPVGSRTAARAAAFHIDLDDIVTGSEPAAADPARTLPPIGSSTTTALPGTAPTGFVWPVQGMIARRFGPSGTGVRMDGIKIAVPAGTPVLATADGTVAYTGSDVPGLGGLVMVKHGGGWTSIYGHNSKILVQRGQTVKQGEPIALSGASGRADRPELHFELRRGRAPVDPATQLPARSTP